MSNKLLSAWKINDKKANYLIFGFSTIVFVAVAALSKIKLHVQLPFNEHVFASLNAILNSLVTVLLIAGLYYAKNGKIKQHRTVMVAALVCSVLFLLSYILHHLFAGETLYGDINKDGVVDFSEKLMTEPKRTIYRALLMLHIPLAGIILPFILFTAYRGLTNQINRHKKLAKITWPLWLFVAVSGVIIYLMIKPYY